MLFERVCKDMLKSKETRIFFGGDYWLWARSCSCLILVKCFVLCGLLKELGGHIQISNGLKSKRNLGSIEFFS